MWMIVRWLQFKSGRQKPEQTADGSCAPSRPIPEALFCEAGVTSHPQKLWTCMDWVREKWAPMRKSGALLQEGRVMVDSRQPLSRNSTLLSLWNRQLNGVQVANGRKEITELGKRLQVRKVWKWKSWWLDVGYSTQQGTKTSPEEASCCQWDAVMVGARGKQVRLTLPKQLQPVIMSYQTVK